MLNKKTLIFKGDCYAEKTAVILFFIIFACLASGCMTSGPLSAEDNAREQQNETVTTEKRKTAILAAIILSIIIYRPFCRYMCPLGAMYGMMNGIAVIRYSVGGHKCTKCGKCKDICPMDIPVYEKPNSPECIRCGKCRAACPSGAIEYAHKKKTDCKKPA